MAVTSQLTSLENFNGSPTLTGYGGGAGAGTNDDVIIEGAQSAGRRVDNTTNKGFGATITSVDLSGAGEHIKVWLFVTQWAEVTQVQVRISSGSDDDHELPTAEYPPLGGFIPVWVDVSRAPEVGGSANEAAITEIGVLLDIGDVGGNADNLILDEIMHGTSGYLWTATGGDLGDFRTYEGTNAEGVLVTLNGVDFCYSRLEIGSATATGFTDSGFQLIYPDQSLVSTTFMGLTVDLQNASTDVDLSNATLGSSDPTGASRRPDILVTGTSGVFDMDTMVLPGMRTIELTSGCSLTNSIVSNSGVVDATVAGTNGADLSGTSILTSIVAANASALIWDVNADPDGELDNMTFTKGTAAHHAIEFGTSIPSSITLRDCNFTGFSASQDVNDSIFHFRDTAGTITLNLVGCTADVSFVSSYRTDGATIVIVEDPVTLTVTASETDGTVIENARVLVTPLNGTGPLPFQESVTITRSGTTATVSHTAHGLSNGDKVVIRGATQLEYQGVKTISNVSTNAYDYTVTGSPTTPATGTITSTAAIISGLTNVSGQISDTRTYGSNQPITGRARKSSASPYLRDGIVAGTISATGGLNTTTVMASDE